MNQKNLPDIFKNSQKGESFFKSYSEYLSELLISLDHESIEEVADFIIEQAKKGKTLYIIGNGGSAATASHFAIDLSHSSLIDHKQIVRAISLTDNTPFMTALSNDVGYEYVFSNQLDRLATEGDILIAISASGNSANLVAAFNAAKKLGVHTIAFSGFDGGKISDMADKKIVVRTVKGEYGPVEDVHVALMHMLCSYIALKINEGKEF